MYHSSLADVFNAGTRAASPFIQEETAKLKEKNDIELKYNAARIKTNLDNYVRDNPYNGNADEYFGKIQDYTHKLYDEAAQTNTSPYFQKTLEVQRAVAVETSRNYVLQQEDAWRVKKEGASFEEDIKSYIDSGWAPEMALDAIDNRVKLTKTRRQIGPEEEANFRKGAERAVYEKFASDAMGAASDVNKLEDVLDALHKRFEFMPKAKTPVYDENGNEAGTLEKPWGYEGKDEWERGLVEKATKRIQEAHWNQIQEAEGLFNRYIRSGDITAAIEFGKEWGAFHNKYYDPRNSEHGNLSGQQLRQSDDYFDIGKLKGYLEQGKEKNETGKKNNDPVLSAIADYEPELFIRPQFLGDGTVIVGNNADGTPITRTYKSLKEAIEGFIGFQRSAFMYSKGGEDAATLHMWENERAKWFEKLFNEIKTAMNQRDDQLQIEFDQFRKFDTYIKKGTKDEPNEYYNEEIGKLNLKDPKDLKLRDDYAQRCIDFFHTIFYNGPTSAAAVRQAMRDFTGQEIIKLLQYKEIKSGEAEQLKQLKAFSDKAMSGGAEDVVFVKYEPERLVLGLTVSGKAPEPTYLWRDEKQQLAVETVREEERERTANILGLSLVDLQPYWMPSSRRKGDVIPKGIFVVEKGDNAGTYYMDYDGSANQVVMKQNPSTGLWEEHKKVERPQTTEERKKSYENTVADYMEILTSKKHPETGKDFDYEKEAPPSIAPAAWNFFSKENKKQTWANYLWQQGQGRQ